MKQFTGYLTGMVGLACIDFSEFWQLYPRKNGRKIAEHCWKKMSYGDQSAAIDGLKLWCRSLDWKDLQFVPYASTFLNQQRWKEMPVALNLEKPDRGGTAIGGARYSARDIEYYERNGLKL